MPVEFLGIAATNDGSEITARSGASFDKDYTLRLARAHEENGWDRVLFAYGSGSPDPNAAAAYIASKTSTLQLLLAHRPNVSYPTFAARTFATIDQISDGRVTVHFITGGTDHEQQREGDYLTHDERSGRKSNALVGTPETVAAAICDYIDLGVDIISMRGYDLLADAVEVGRKVIPIVREEVARRDRAADKGAVAS